MTEAVSDQAAAAAHETLGLRARTPANTRRDDDPLAAVLGLGERAARVGAAIGLGLAITSHGALSGQALASAALHDMRQVAREMRLEVHDYLWTTYEVELPQQKPQEPEKPKEPDPPPAPDPEPVPVAPAPKNTPPPKDEPYDPPPAAAEAAKILTRESDPDEVLDMTDRGIASGEGSGVGYGQVAGAGTAKAPTFDPNAKVGGVPGATGTGRPQAPPPPPPAGPDLSRAPTLVGGTSWNCPFPPEADAEQIDQARAVISVTVRPDGSALSVKVVSDPGHGFGRAARICALGRRYTPGVDRTGNPITSTTPPITVRFTR